jgi:lathosterol oxidase
MDIPLECFDTFIFDYFYSALLPAHPVPYSLKNGVSNSSVADASTWQYQPATKFLSFEPRDAAYNSQWTRDNPYRQMMSLFIITWCVLPPPPAPPMI